MELFHKVHISKWVRSSLFNFLLVAMLGITLRYKIIFSLPIVNFKYLLHAHSHFAFSGWLTTGLCAGLVHILQQTGRPNGRSYTLLFWLLQIASFGMLSSFPFQGYGPVSIFFSVLSLVFSWCFAWKYCKDMTDSALSPLVQRWVRAALFFYVLSGLGPILLGYGMAHYLGQSFYFNALYLFLHFQYNGWFTCAVAGLFFYCTKIGRIQFSPHNERLFFRLVVYSCLPAYCLSLLWMAPPVWVRGIAIVAAIGQLCALALFCREGWCARHRRMGGALGGGKWLWMIVGLAWSVKTVLQGLTVIPILGQFAFGFRPVIIAYLHLVMLVFVSLFLLGFFLREGLVITGSRTWKTGLPLLVTGILLNELLLCWDALPGLRSHFTGLPYLLFSVACLIGLGLTLINLSQVRWPVYKKNSSFQPDII